MSPIDVTLDMEGIVTDYPFDEHEAALELYLTKVETKEVVQNEVVQTVISNGAPPIADTLAVADTLKAVTTAVKEEDQLEVNLFTKFYGSLPGFKLDATLDKLSKGNLTLVNLTVHRFSTIVIIVIFAMALMWMITLTVMLMLLSVVLRERKIEFGMFAFMAGFLFSFVAFRNAMPGVPPIGTLSDYLAFFWGYALLSLSLIVLTITWLIRPAK